MMNFSVGGPVSINNNRNGRFQIVDAAVEGTSRTIYTLAGEGNFYPEDSRLVSEMNSDAQPRSVIVTGGAGYIGSVLIRMLLHENYNVVCIDNLRYGGEALSGVWGHPDFLFVQADITNYA